ncbi:RNA-directed DNA polymerase, eukaryota, reverse transcriptase zinc-binding domain protein [Tanacetum coccineum]
MKAGQPEEDGRKWGDNIPGNASQPKPNPTTSGNKEKASSVNDKFQASGSILEVMDELIKSLQETKMEKMDLFSIKALWGNLSFNYAFSPSIGYSGGSYRKKDVMGLYSSFDRFLGWKMCPLRTGLIDLPLEGYSFTWAHKSASKMSKLGYILTYFPEGFIKNSIPLSALCLEKHLSDHRPIHMLRELKWLIMLVFVLMELLAMVNWILEPSGGLKNEFLSTLLDSFAAPSSNSLSLDVTFVLLLWIPQIAVPKGVLSKMESIRRNFFNGVENAEKKMSLIGWNKILASKKSGGLGVSTIYGICGALDNSSSYSRRSHWLDIVNEVRKLASKGIDLLSLVKKKVGNGEANSFWNDVWLEEKLLLLISNTSSVILSNISDRWSWLLVLSSNFSVKSTREFIDDFMLPKTDVPTRWIKYIPIKINNFAWRVSLDKLPTRLNISLRGLDIPSIICPLCSIIVELNSHLLFSCQLACQLIIKVVH